VVRLGLTTTVLPGLVIAGALMWSYTERRPEGGVEIRAVAAGACPDGRPTCPRAAYVRVTKPQRRDTLAGGRVAASAPLRLRLQPGSYVVRPGRHGRWRARAVRVYVPPEDYVPVLVRYRAVPLAPSTASAASAGGSSRISAAIRPAAAP
jgi:hypothetical protein